MATKVKRVFVSEEEVTPGQWERTYRKERIEVPDEKKATPPPKVEAPKPKPKKVEVPKPKPKVVPKCGNCGEPGHNRRNCPQLEE